MDNAVKTEEATKAVTHVIYDAGFDPSEYLTSTQLHHKLQVSLLTVHHWRKLSNPIPFLTKQRGIQRHFVLFPIIAVHRWLQTYKPHLVKLFMENTCGCRHCTKQDTSLPVPQGDNTLTENTIR